MAGTDARSFKEVLTKELYEIFQSRTARGISSPIAQPEPGAPAEAVFSKAHASQLTGLAFSGGGIRSATFNLGVLQGLAKLGLLNRFDYLSTVSGGGYIGSWLSTWIRNRDIESNSSEPGIATVANALKRGPNDANTRRCMLASADRVWGVRVARRPERGYGYAPRRSRATQPINSAR